MTLQIYNTLSRKKESFEPLNPPNVTIYNCGPTVYDHFHIGNARNFVVMDIIRQYLVYRGYHVRFIQNLTDIDDKIIHRANEEGVLFQDITDRYIPCYFEDAEKLRIHKADYHPRATEHIGDIINLIQRLIDQGLAYESEGSVYYSVRSFKEYGKLSGRSLDDLLEGARVEINESKRDPLDFALWKLAKPAEPSWSSPWGEGRPGWHIECSAMAMKHLGESIDIHSGGTDLTFPHHENEIAQCEGVTHVPFARYWMHNGFLNIDGNKMSKSLGNFRKVDEILEHYPAPVIRYFLLSAHYRHPLDLSEDALQEASAAVRRINDAIETGRKILSFEPSHAHSEACSGANAEADALRTRFETSMDDDFNTPRALAVLFDVVGLIHEARNTLAQSSNEARIRQTCRLIALVELGSELQHFFGLDPDQEGASADDSTVDDLMAILIETRRMARAHKLFEAADMIRDRLMALGIVLEDHPQGTIWKRKME